MLGFHIIIYFFQVAFLVIQGKKILFFICFPLIKTGRFFNSKNPRFHYEKNITGKRMIKNYQWWYLQDWNGFLLKMETMCSRSELGAVQLLDLGCMCQMWVNPLMLVWIMLTWISIMWATCVGCRAGIRGGGSGYWALLSCPSGG